MFAACAASSAPPREAPVEVAVADAGSPSTMPMPEAATPDAGYTASAAGDFEAAEVLWRARRFEEANVAYAEVIRKYHYSSYAKRAELRIADMLFARADFAGAAAAYDTWLHDHRADEQFAVVARRAAAARCRVTDAGPCADDHDAGIR